jgi:hypothetical protein
MVSPRGMKIYTVLDARPSAPPRYLLQTLLLAHSWAAQSGAPPLKVMLIGTAPRPVQARLLDLGIELGSSPPHSLDVLSRTTNKLVALREADDGPVLLVDNDVFFLDDLATLGGRGVSASVAGRARVTAAQWSHVKAATGLRPLADDATYPLDELKARTRRAPKRNLGLYLNTGVVWIEQPAAFGSIWSASTAAIARAFEDHSLSSPWVRGWGSDQAGFAAAVAEQGDFSLLSRSYNLRPVCFRLGLPEHPKILHLLKLGAKGPAPFSKLLTAWWNRSIIKPIMRDREDAQPSWRTVEERDRLLDEAVTMRNHVLTLGMDARLDDLLPLEVA